MQPLMRELMAVENTLVKKTDFDTELKKIKLQKLDIDHLEGKNIIEQNYLVFAAMNKYFDKVSNT